jgi:DNA-binding MarR family transcriptional regulator
MSDANLSKLILDTIPKSMRSIRNEMRQFAKGQLTVPQFRILVKLAKGASTHKEVAEWLGITPATLTRMIDTLVERKVVQRQIDPNDRRQTILQATAQGKTQYERYRAKAQANLQEKMSVLSETEKHDLSKGLEALAKLFSEF